MPTIIQNIKRLVHLNTDGRLQRTANGDIVNIGGTSHTTFTVGGRGLLFDDGSSTGGGHGAASVTLQNAYNNQVDTVTGDAIVNLIDGQDLVFKTQDGTNTFTIEALTGNVSITGLLNGINFDGLVQNVSTHTTVSTSSKHTAAEISVTPVSASPTSTNVQEILDQLQNIIYSLSGNAGFGIEHIQQIPATVWTVNHNKNTKKVHWTLWDEDDESIMPDKVLLLNNNTLEVYFGSPQVGRIVLMTF